MRGMLGLVSLLLIGVAAAFYFTATQPEVAQQGTYNKIESQANAAAAQMAKDPQTEVDAATKGVSAPAATNAAPSGD
jgi:hypothetical protein